MPNDHRELYAVDLTRLPREELGWETIRDGIDLERLPKTLVLSPSSCAEGAAVLSWRWDRIHFAGRSRNVALALLHAKDRGLQYLYFDHTSVPQTNSRETLLRDVVNFSRLYSRLPVIAAYDECGKSARDFQNTMERPWIRHELRHACTNPTSVTHVGFLGERRELSFENELWSVRHSGFATLIYDLLHGTVEMTNAEDLALILPEFESAFASAFACMQPNDYLFTAFLLTAYYEPGQTVENGKAGVYYGKRINYHSTCFSDGQFQRYTLGPSGSTGRAYEWKHDILFDREPVAVLRTKMTSSFDRNWVEVLTPGIARLLDALRLPPGVRSRFDEREPERRASLYVDHTAPQPDVEERVFDLEQGEWTEAVRPAATSLGFTPKGCR